ncbi:hypothetical protein V5O48_015338 [Marasmius crinis-equi]|uniref:Uncharacterized protein n=1 Tax=Marasmius crinis-equi TaxID=585013 RepID=A0ABR3EUT1_9AGAR
MLFKLSCPTAQRSTSSHVDETRVNLCLTPVMIHLLVTLHDTLKSQIASTDQQITIFSTGNNYNHGAFRFNIAMWVAESARTSETVEDNHLVKAFKIANSQLKLVGADSVARDIIDIYEMAVPHIEARLRKYPGLFNFSFDGWSACNTSAFLGMWVHFIEKVSLVSILMDFILLKKRHTVEYLALQFTNSVKSFKVKRKVLGLTRDNAGCCLLHIFNLVDKVVCQPFTAKAKDKKGEVDEDSNKEEDAERDDNEEDEGNGEITGEWDGENNEEVDNDRLLANNEVDPGHDKQDELVLEEIVEELEDILKELNLSVPLVTDEEFALAHSTFRKSHTLAKKLHYSSALKNELEDLCNKYSMKYITIKRLITSTLNKLCNPPIPARCAPKSNRLSKEQKALKDLKLLEEEWEMVEAIMPLLQEFVYAAQHMQTNKRPMLFQVIKYMDVMNDLLEEWVSDISKPNVIRYGAAKALGLLDKYYAKTDDSIMPQVAMSKCLVSIYLLDGLADVQRVLHPQEKMSYFEGQKWPDDWKNAARTAVAQLWETHYKPKNSDLPSTASTTEEIFDQKDRFATKKK